jgi:long-chain acyl-CoA synthetase
VSNLATLLTQTAERSPQAPAIKFMGNDISYAALSGMAAKLAGSLRENGIQPGDRVAIILPNVPAFPVIYWAILMAGGAVVPMNPLLKAGEIDYFFTDSGAKMAFVWPDFVEEATKGAANSGTRIIPTGPMGPVEGQVEGGEPITEPLERDDEDTAVILYTSGTTGRPKGAELTHRNIRLNAQRCSGDILVVSPDDVIIGCLPLFHVFGLVVGLVAATNVGASLALIPRFDPAEACRRCMPRSSTTRTASSWSTRTSASAPVADRPCRWRSCAASRRSSGASSSRATGCPRPARSRPSTCPTVSASPARSASRSPAAR